MDGASARLADELRRHGSLPFSRFMEIALYDDEVGFYQMSGMAGRRGDFITSPEVGPLFGAVMGRFLDSEWRRLGEPDPFFVIEVGAGPGTLAKAILHSEPICTPALRYVLVERSDRQRSRHSDILLLEAPELLLGAVDTATLEHEIVAGQGPIVASIRELPSMEIDGVVISNELFDNLPFDIAVHDGHGWCERLVVLQENAFAWRDVPMEENPANRMHALCPEAKPGDTVPVIVSAKEMMLNMESIVRSGSVLAIDYGATTDELAKRDGEWLRMYREHQRVESPLMSPGLCDITGDVPFDQLFLLSTPTDFQTQRDFLFANGISELVDEGNRIWQERAHFGDLTALKARSRSNEAAVLLDDSGLGGFRVAQWQK